MAARLLSVGYKWYVLAVITLTVTMNFFDRGLVVLLLQTIKVDLHLSDTQLGLLTGISYALFYATLGIPVARWSDRGNRAAIAAMSIGVWGIMMMLFVFVRSFSQLILVRIAASIGEAGCMPPTYSLLGDYFAAPKERTRAMALYWLASPIAQLLSFLVGAWVNDRYGWRMTFLVMGAPAVLLAVLIKSTVIELRASRVSGRAASGPPLRYSDALRSVWNSRAARHLCIAIIIALTLSMGLYPWYAAFMVRSHGMAVGELGIWFGLIFGIGGTTGTLLGGYVAGPRAATGERKQLEFAAALTALLMPCFVLFLLLPQTYQALAALVPLIVAFNFFLAPAFALLQRLVIDEVRATTLAVILLVANLIGMGVGAQAVGVLSDLLMPSLGKESLRYAMLVMSTLAVWAAYHFWQAGQTVKEDLAMLAGDRPTGALSKVSSVGLETG